jgi:hypothetical protein
MYGRGNQWSYGGIKGSKQDAFLIKVSSNPGDSIDELRDRNFCGIFVSGSGYSDENLQALKAELSKDFGEAILISESQKSYLFRIPGEK